MNITPVVKAYLVGDGSNTIYTLSHNLATTDVMVQVYEISTGSTVDASVTRTSGNAIDVEFAIAPSTNAYKVVIMGIQSFTF